MSQSNKPNLTSLNWGYAFFVFCVVTTSFLYIRTYELDSDILIIPIMLTLFVLAFTLILFIFYRKNIISDFKEEQANRLKREADKKDRLVKQEERRGAFTKREEVLKQVSALILHDYKNEIVPFTASFKIANVAHFGELLAGRQKEIDKEYILPFVKLREYLMVKQKSIHHQVELLNGLISNNEKTLSSLAERLKGQEHRWSGTEVEYYQTTPTNILIQEIRSKSDVGVRPQIEALITQNNYLGNLHALSVKMLDSLVQGDMVLFFTIYNQFEKLGIFNKEWENRLVSIMEDINDNLLTVIDEIRNMESTVNGSLYELQLEVGLANA